MPKTNQITINDKSISIIQGTDKSNYICLTDMVRAQEKDVERVNMVIQNWLRRKDTIEYIGLWEHLNNPNFNDIEFDVIKNNSGTNRFILTAKEWTERTGAIGIIAKVGRYGGTYAHKDIAYNYTIHTDAIKTSILPTLDIEKTKEHIIYASEADLLNIVLFGCTAKDWQDANPELAGKMNIRDTASINELLVLSNLESYNSELIHQGKTRPERYELLMDMRNKQLEVLQQANADFNFKRLTGNDPKQLTDK